MKSIISFAVILMAVLLISCGGKKQNIASRTFNVELENVEKNKAEAPTADAAVASDSAASTVSSSNTSIEPRQASPQPDWDKKIIKTATINVEVDDFKNFNVFIHNNVKKYDAYIAGEQQNQSEGKIENVITIKVPVNVFEELLSSLPEKGVKVHEKRISTDDVTAEVVDTKARTEAKKQAREQYLAFLKKAKNIKEVLEVQNEINDIQEEIEAGAGRAKYLTNQAAYSTINLTYFQYLEGSPTTDAPGSLVTRLKEAFNAGTSMLSGLLVFIATIWPLILIAVLVWLTYKRYQVKPVKIQQKS